MSSTRTDTRLPYGISVTDYGAIGDGVADDGPAIQSALDSGAPLVAIPRGVYQTGSGLGISSHTRLVVHPQARLFLADGAGSDSTVHLLTNRHHEEGDEDIHVEGGIWDGNNPGNPRGPDAPGSYTGVLMCFTNVRGLSLRSVTLRDPESYFVRLGQASDFEIGDVRFEAPHLRPNQDGIHVGGFCEDGYIHDLVGIGVGTPNDDVVTLTADDANGRAQNLGKLNGPIRRMRIRNLVADDCHTFVRLLSVDNPVEDAWIESVRGGCRVSAVNMDACRECRVPLFDPDEPGPEGVGSIERVTLRDFDVYKSTAETPKPLLDFRTRVRDFTFSRFHRGDRDAAPDVPTLRLAEFGPCSATLETSDPARLAHLEASSDVSVAIMSPMASAAGVPSVRAEFAVEPGGSFSFGGSFELLELNPTPSGGTATTL